MADAGTLFDLIAPELADSANKQAAIDLADGQTSEVVFKEQRPYAVALLAAHTLTVAGRKGQSGGVSSTKEGSLSLGFGRVNPMGSAQLETTSYGAELVRMRQAFIMGARTVLV